MDALLPALLILLALLLGAGAGWLIGRSRSAGELAAAQARSAAAEALAGGLREQLTAVRAGEAERQERERQERSVLTALAPVQESLRRMQQQMLDLERERSEQFGTLSTQLRQAREGEERLRETTASLASALSSNSTRGVWGETQLRRVVEAAGLTRHVDFDLQHSLTGTAGTGRPDMVVRLPGGANVAVDAKVPLDDYLAASAIPAAAPADEETRRKELLRRHSRAVRAHVDALSKRSYWEGLDGSPEFVICFIPSEALLAAALDEDPTLLDHAFGKRVALASPVNLWSVLKTISFAWSQHTVSEEARTLFELGNTLYQRLGTLAGHADSLRRAIERTVNSYNQFAGALESRVLVTARQFPGIDEGRLDALTAPAEIETSPRGLHAPELNDALDAARAENRHENGAEED